MIFVKGQKYVYWFGSQAEKPVSYFFEIDVNFSKVLNFGKVPNPDTLEKF